MKKIIPAFVSILLLSGCASSFLKSDEPPVTIFSLRAAQNLDPIGEDQKAKSNIIDIRRPFLPPGFDSARIAMYLENGRRLDYYSGAKWPSPLDETLLEFTSQTARKTLPNIIIAAPGQATESDYRLQMRVNDFQPVYSGGPDQLPQLVASISFTLLKMPEERIVTSFTIDQQETAQANTLSLITAGLEHLLQSVEAKALETVAIHLK